MNLKDNILLKIEILLARFLHINEEMHELRMLWYFVTKIVVIVLVRKILKFEAEGREFGKKLRSLEQFIQTVKSQNNIW